MAGVLPVVRLGPLATLRRLRRRRPRRGHGLPVAEIAVERLRPDRFESIAMIAVMGIAIGLVGAVT